MLPFKVTLPPDAFVGNVEAAFANADVERAANTHTLLISFESVEAFDLQTMMLLVALSSARKKKGKRTIFSLPAQTNPMRDRVLMLLYEWKFFDIVAERTQSTQLELVDNPAEFEPVLRLTKFVEKGPSFESLEPTDYCRSLAKRYFRNFYRDDEGLKALHFEKGFFRLSSWPFAVLDDQVTTLRTLPTHWDKNSLIVSVLEKRMDAGLDRAMPIAIQNKLANDIVKECLTNSIRHPKANALITGSHFDGKGLRYTIVIWDNGKNIIESLHAALSEQGTIRSDESFLAAAKIGLNPAFYLSEGDEYKVGSMDSLDLKSRVKLSDELPASAREPWTLLLAAFFPGVTRDILKQDLESTMEGFRNELVADFSGFGLTVLLESVINLLNGIVSVRVKDHFITLKRIQTPIRDAIFRQMNCDVYLPDLDERYKKLGIPIKGLRKASALYQVKVVRKTDAFDFEGNMLTIEIPLRK